MLINAVALLVFLAVCNKASSASDKIRIDIHQSDEAIRKELLNYTPQGSHADDVIEFVLYRLDYKGTYNSGVGIMPKPALEVMLGHSFGIIAHEATNAKWIFDKHLKLERVAIRRYVTKAGGTNSHPRPRVRISLRQPDENIRQQLLNYTPVGSDLAAVQNFIGDRLYFQGGPSGYGEALTGKPGIGVILGHYLDGDAGVQKSVRVNWVRNGQNKLRDIEVRRVDSVAPLFPLWPLTK